MFPSVVLGGPILSVRHFFKVSGFTSNIIATIASVMQSAIKAAAAGPWSAGSKSEMTSTAKDAVC